MTYRVLSLFAGIGGFDLGLERTGGFRTVAFCEIEPFAVRVLNKHWPEVPVYGDVRELTAERLTADGVIPDCIVGGFPCQDISSAGLRAGIDGERSGLWSEYARLIRELQPRYVIVENVAALLSRGMGRVLGDLAALGYDAEWHCIPASAIGAPHRRDRVWIIAYPEGNALGANANSVRSHRAGMHLVRGSELRDEQEREPQPLGADVADAECIQGVQRLDADLQRRRAREAEQTWLGGDDVAHSKRRGLQGGHEQCARPAAIIPAALGRHCGGSEFGAPWWSEPNVGRVAHGVPYSMERLRGLGNAVVPQIPELIGRAILAAEQERRLAA